MLDILPDPHQFASEEELLFDGVEGHDGGGGGVGAEEIPGVEAGEVLEGAEDFVATNWRGELDGVGGVEGRDDEGLPVVATKRK